MMASRTLKAALVSECDVLFVYIGWARRYDGTEPINGNFSWLKENVGAEARAFLSEAGYFHCGIGAGSVPGGRVHVVFVAQDPSDLTRKVVGIYARAETYQQAQDSWFRARTKHAMLISPSKRIPIPSWPGYMGTRRWAQRGDGASATHASLLKIFDQLRGKIVRGRLLSVKTTDSPLYDIELEAFEGQMREKFIRHRKREQRLRLAKIKEALSLNNGRLVCEVQGCGFDFQKVYGDLGSGYAQVHHLKPLSAAPHQGERVKLKSLAIVCANCHAMIHLGGENRPLNSLMRKRARASS
jgi:5-methylcytosine-specific restriction endonuclease McrA